MPNTIPDLYRQLSVGALFATPTMRASWPAWQTEIRRILGQNYSENELLNLGDHLSSIFRTTGGQGRGQAEVSGGGAAWECLVCWYLNLCTAGSRIVAVKKNSLVPKSVRDAMTVNYGNFACNTESDITVIVFPDRVEYNADVSTLQVTDASNSIMAVRTRNGSLSPHVLDRLADHHNAQFEIGIVQCKTNWNDNAQIPMLWDMIYSAGGFPGRNISIGRNGYNIQACRRFTYSFVTVPTQNSPFSPNGTPVKRVTNLSGGNYWGNPTQQNVARSIKEIFNNNFRGGYRMSLRDDLRTSLPLLGVGQTHAYFQV